MSKKILIVDDTLIMRILLEQTLKRLGDQDVELLLAADGERGLELALTERPDLIFLDINMPNVSGYEVCQRIKAADSGMYVILLTGQAADQERGAAVGADEHVVKPFHPNYILERAVTVLGLDL